LLDGSDGVDGTVDSRHVVELARLTLYADAQERRVGELQATVSQLQAALDSRVAIERAVGMLAERFRIPLPDAFELLRSAARNSRREVRALAEQIAASREETPVEIVQAFGHFEPS
jgi:AmiR/NasT family two-component response regulator